MAGVTGDAKPSDLTLPMSATAPAQAVATIIGSELPDLPGYRCERLLGRGGMGEVWLAQHLALQRSVALKVLRPELAKDSAFTERFLREARAAAKLTHPGVVSVHDAGQVAGHLYLAMEFVPGGDLHQRMIARSLSVDQAIDLIIRAAEGLQAIHDAGLVHRDLKPDNILIDAQGHPRIADLGLARTQIGDDRMTATGMAMGTPSYMSPEQAKGSPDLDGRSDTYSLAATLFALLAGRPPFSGPTPYVTVAQVLNDPAPDLHAINARVPAAVAAVIAQALAKQPDQRPASARAFAQALEAARSGGAVPLTPRSRRRLWLIGGGVAAVALIGVLIAIFAGGKTSAEPIDWKPVTTTDVPADVDTVADTTAATVNPPPETAREAFRSFRDSWRGMRGALRESLAATLPAVHHAVVAALKNHNLTVIKNEGSASAAHLETTLGDGTSLTIALTSAANGTTDVVIQIGKLGDAARSKTVLQWIRDEL